jgi:hypothetical protein
MGLPSDDTAFDIAQKVQNQLEATVLQALYPVISEHTASERELIRSQVGDETS